MSQRHVWSAMLVAAAVGVGCGDDQEVLVATLSGSNEVPAVTTSATGTATFTIMDDGTVSYTITVAGIQNVTASHIHDGAAGANGPVAVDFMVAAFSGDGTLATGTLTSSTTVTGMSFDELLTRMRAGTVYVNVHTQANQAGEIRGQIAPQ